MTSNRFERPAGPSEHPGAADEFRHTETEKERPRDVMPKSDPEFLAGPESGPPRDVAALRLRVEQLLRRREPAPFELWQALGPDAPTMLLRLVNDPGLDEPLRHSAIATIGRIGPPAAADRLGALLLDPQENELTRTYAASALGRLGGDEAATWLSRATTDDSEMVRLQLARSLGRIGAPLAAESLRVLANDRVEWVAKAAASALDGEGAARPEGTVKPRPPQPDRPVAEEERSAGAASGWKIPVAVALTVIGLGLTAWLLSRTRPATTLDILLALVPALLAGASAAIAIRTMRQRQEQSR